MLNTAGFFQVKEKTVNSFEIQLKSFFEVMWQVYKIGLSDRQQQWRSHVTFSFM